MKTLNLPISILLVILFTSFGAGAAGSLTPQAKQMLLALAGHNYDQARQMAANMPPSDAIVALTPAARLNNTHAQWILAEAYERGGHKQQMANWAYTARMGTVLDASICGDIRAREASALLALPYEDLLRKIRRDPIMEQNATRFAGTHYAETWNKWQNPGWACKSWARLMNKGNIYADTAPAGSWNERRKSSLNRMFKRMGAGDLEARDIVHPTDPLKRDFGAQEDFGRID